MEKSNLTYTPRVWSSKTEMQAIEAQRLIQKMTAIFPRLISSRGICWMVEKNLHSTWWILLIERSTVLIWTWYRWDQIKNRKSNSLDKTNWGREWRHWKRKVSRTNKGFSRQRRQTCNWLGHWQVLEGQGKIRRNSSHLKICNKQILRSNLNSSQRWLIKRI